MQMPQDHHGQPRPQCPCDDLHESEARYRRAERGTNDGLWEWNMTTGEHYFSPRWFAILGFLPGELPACIETFADLVHPDDRAVVWGALDRHLQIGEAYDVEHRMRHKSGEYLWVRSRGHLSEEHGVKRMSGSLSDISPQKRAEQHLQQAHQLAGLGPWEFDLENKRMWWSPQKCRLHGLQPGAAVTLSTFMRQLPPEELVRFNAAFVDLLESGHLEIKIRVIWPNGETHHQHTVAMLTRDVHGQPIRIHGTTRDITEQVRTEEALLRSLAEKELLLREIHHRVKNNLAVVGSYLYFQAKKLPSASDAAALVELRQRIQAMALVHEQLCGEHNVARVEFHSYVRQLVDDLTRSDERNHVHFHVDAEPLLLPIEMATPLGQILCELITNTLKYAYPGRSGEHAWISVTHDATHLRLYVADHGVGLPANVEPRTANSFGWLLVRSLVRQLEGELDIVSEQGLRVGITLPIQPATATAGFAGA